MPRDFSVENDLMQEAVFKAAPDLRATFTGLCGTCETRFLDDKPVRNTEMYVESLKSPELRAAEARRASLFAGGSDRLGVFADPTIGQP